MALLKVSVVIPVRNEERRITPCLESMTDFDEVLLLDGNSTDRTREIASRFPNVRIVKQYDTDEPNVVITNFAEVRNKGVALARNDWVLAADADVIVTQEVVREIEAILQNPSCLFYDIPRKYLLHGEQLIDFASIYTRRSRCTFCLFSKKLDPVYVGRMDPVPVIYDERLTRRGRLKNYVLNLYVEPVEVLEAKQRRFITGEMAALEERALTLGWWAGTMWHHGIRVPFLLWRISLAQVKCHVLHLGQALPWRYERRLKLYYKLKVMRAITRVYVGQLRQRLTPSAKRCSAGERP